MSIINEDEDSVSIQNKTDEFDSLIGMTKEDAGNGNI